jgi:hypothetical protein
VIFLSWPAFLSEPLLQAILYDNPWLRDTLRTRGSRGGAFWLFLGGKNCPQGVCVLKVHKDSPLAAGAEKPPDKHGMVAIGELRCANNGVIRGIHQKGCIYKWLVPNTDQLIYFNGWLQVALESLYAREPRPGQAVVLTGKKDCGKSLLQSLITKILGDRMAKPYLYMSGQTSFNGNLFGAEHLSIEDEQPYTDIHSRRNFGAKIKEITAIEAQDAHKKFRDGVTLPVFWRLTISVNDEAENLMILPPFDDSLSDKLMIFKVCEGAIKDQTATLAQRTAFWKKLTSELPAYIDYLLNTWVIEKDFVSQRYGVTHFQHPEVLLKLGELAPETRLLQLIDAEIFKSVNGIARTLDWDGGAIELEKVLTSSLSDVQYQARSLLNWQGACGTYLGRLKKQYPARISHTRPHRGSCIWTIKAPP